MPNCQKEYLNSASDCFFVVPDWNYLISSQVYRSNFCEMEVRGDATLALLFMQHCSPARPPSAAPLTRDPPVLLPDPETPSAAP